MNALATSSKAKIVFKYVEYSIYIIFDAGLITSEKNCLNARRHLRVGT